MATRRSRGVFLCRKVAALGLRGERAVEDQGGDQRIKNSADHRPNGFGNAPGAEYAADQRAERGVRARKQRHDDPKKRHRDHNAEQHAPRGLLTAPAQRGEMAERLSQVRDDPSDEPEAAGNDAPEAPRENIRKGVHQPEQLGDEHTEKAHVLRHIVCGPCNRKAEQKQRDRPENIALPLPQAELAEREKRCCRHRRGEQRRVEPERVGIHEKKREHRAQREREQQKIPGVRPQTNMALVLVLRLRRA